MLTGNDDWSVQVFPELSLPSAGKKPPDDLAGGITLALAEAGDPCGGLRRWAKEHPCRFPPSRLRRDGDGELGHQTFAGWTS